VERKKKVFLLAIASTGEAASLKRTSERKTTEDEKPRKMLLLAGLYT
jgi:hypothetical protein